MKRLIAPLAALALVAACEAPTTAPSASSSSALLDRGGQIVHHVSAGGADWAGAGVDANWSLTAFEMAACADSGRTSSATATAACT